MSATLNAAAQKALSEVELLPNETIAQVFQADGFFMGANPIAKVIASINSFFTSLTGGHIRIFLVLTNERVLMVQSSAMWFGCTKVRKATIIALSGVKEAGIARETQLCCFHARLVHIQSLTETYTMVVKKFGDQELRDFLRSLSSLIINNSKTV
jgi:hypothetical protein